MKKRVGTVSLILLVTGQAGAGELLLSNGSRLDGELANEVLVISTGSDLVEVAPEQVRVLGRNEVRLKDGRILKGTFVGGHVKVRTALGEISVKPDELRVYRADATTGQGTTATSAAPSTVAAVPAPSSAPGSESTGRTPASLSARVQAVDAEKPLPSVPLYQEGTRAGTVGSPPLPATAPSAPAPATPPAGTSGGTSAGTAAGTLVAAIRTDGGRHTPGRRLEVVASESALRRDAVTGADAVGKVVRGEQVTYLDSIDRRLQILNVLVFDGGHWIKVRAASGVEGWLPAGAVQEVR